MTTESALYLCAAAFGLAAIDLYMKRTEHRRPIAKCVLCGGLAGVHERSCALRRARDGGNW